MGITSRSSFSAFFVFPFQLHIKHKIRLDEQRLASIAKGDEPCRLVFDCEIEHRQKLVQAQKEKLRRPRQYESFVDTISGVRHSPND